jgi:predicted amidohydrolase
MPWQLQVAAVQMRSIGDLAANLAVCRRLVGEAAAAGARLVVLPECFSFLGSREGEKMVAAEELEAGTGPVMTLLAALCREHRIWIIGGGTPELVAGDTKRAYNTAVVVDPSGQLVARYRKIHLFDVDIPNGATLRESDGTVAGDELEVVMIDDVPVGLSICYDLRFPELYRKLVHDRGAEVVVIPAAFTAHTGAAHWHVLMRARAIENGCFVLAAAQAGHHEAGRDTYGHSIVVSPWGEIIAEGSVETGVIMADLNLADIGEARQRIPSLQHDRDFTVVRAGETPVAAESQT